MKHTHILCVSVAAAATLVALGPAPAQAQTCFKITDLGPIRSSGLGAPFGINNLNQAVFTVDVGLDLIKKHAFVYLPVVAYGLAAGCHDLHLLAGLDPDSQSVVHDLNDAGIAVGSATIDNVTLAFVWRLDIMQFFDLATFDTGTTSVAWAINDDDPPIIVGEGNLSDDCECPQSGLDDDLVQVAYRLALTDPPPTLLVAIQLEADPAQPCDFQTFARDVSTPPPPPAPSQLTNVAGSSSNGGRGISCLVFAPCQDPQDATVWFQNAIQGTVLRDLSAGGSESRGVGDNGGFSGWRFDSAQFNDCQREALYWHSTGVAPLNLGFLVPDDEASRAERITSIGARRQVVGWRIFSPDDGAFLWECNADCGILGNWALTNLNTEEVIGPCLGSWTIKRAYDVNDGGVIIASGFRTGQGTHALLLTPDPACCPADLDGSGDVNVKDLLILLGAWGPCPNCGDCGAQCVADIDCDCDVGVKDENILLGAWGPCPGGGSDGGSSEALDQAVQAMGYDDVEDYRAWLVQAGDADALASGWVLYALLTDGE